MLDAERIALDFPILSSLVNGNPLIYLDNAATTQLPDTVLNAWTEHYKTQNGNVHRGSHWLSRQSTMGMEDARQTIQKFIHAPSPEQIIFTNGTTASLNLIAGSYLRNELEPGDQVIVSEFEHHSNFVVWQQLCRGKDAHFIVVPEKNGTIDIEFFRAALKKRTKLVSMTMISNVTGVRLPVESIIKYSHEAGAAVSIDGAQAIRHGVDVKKLGCDFFCFSGHKMMGPAGTGVLYIAEPFLKKMRPVLFGGGMVDQVGQRDTTFADMPYRLEAGTPNYPGIIGLGHAAQYLENIGISEISEYEEFLTGRLIQVLQNIDGIQILGGGGKKYSVVSAVIDHVHAYDAACLLDKFGVAVRAGNHCAQPIVRRLGYHSVLRFSPAFYNTSGQIEMLEDILSKVILFLHDH